MTVIVRDPGFHEPTDDDCATFWYACRTHHRPYRHEACGEGAHLIALHCQEHGPESFWPDPRMLMFPEGFTPRLSEEQLARVRAEDEAG
ncbi:hypothetical protein AQI88_13495 [Streptomyces cellostaticus]|uniref:Uncharacterized protein n=1 Tax=Streptomyces cellostaticus TaxID=67285 RepID=A0A124HD04_9ACTN|nr:hypothetical protein AQI88_13495 [Streptomyces cellostaticus]